MQKQKQITKTLLIFGFWVQCLICAFNYQNSKKL